MSDYTELDLLDENLRAMLATRTGFPIGLQDIPDSHGDNYAVLYFLYSGGEMGGFGEPTGMRDLYYQITCVSLESNKKARWLQGRVARAVYAYAKTLPGVVGFTEQQYSASTREQEKVYTALTTYSVKTPIRQT
jgi:hypothetical protein